MSISKVIAITGCDSGLGWALAARVAREGLVTVAGLLEGVDTPAAKALVKLNVHPCKLDVTSRESVSCFGQYVRQLISENPNYRLYAVVNNAGVMTIGDYEWNTPDIIQNTVEVNLLGTMRVISDFLPDLRRNAKEGKVKPRLINIASHCGMQPLPGFAAYCASKSGVLSLTQALRYEQYPYGVSAVAFIPGGFVGQSNILSQQVRRGEIMLENLDEEQKSVYAQRLTNLTNYLNQISQREHYANMKDNYILETFTKALLTENPKYMYKVEPWRYKLYHCLFNMRLPEKVHHYLINKFINFPRE